MTLKTRIGWAAGLLIGALLLGPASAQAQSIAGSPHDFHGATWAGTDQLCVFCHTPHNATGTTSETGPLWNRGTTTSTFTVYSSPSLNASPTQPDGNSKACLSCHDGTIAVDAYGGRTGTHFVTGGGLIGTDLSNDHPVSFTYDAALATADGGLVTPASARQVVAGIPLFASKVQCASCHSVHDNRHGDFLRRDNAGSALCLSCHVK